MGISYDDFWKLTPRSLKVVAEGYKLKRQVEDEKNWLLGGYLFEAVSIALGNSFRKKNQKAKSYFEVREKPYLHDLNNEMSETQKEKNRELVLAQLHVMQTNFNLKHGK